MIEPAVHEILQALEIDSPGAAKEIKAIIDAIVRKWNWRNCENLDDMAQECMLRLLQNIRNGKFRGESSLKTFIYAIARNICIDYYKERKAFEAVDADTVELVDESLSAEDVLIHRDQRRVACRILLSLPDECRSLWRAIFFGKRNYKQAGELLRLSEGTVKRRMWECRQMARERLKSYD
jgi:RNA polymerase sigma-70 factor (ECF subfamily)